MKTSVDTAPSPVVSRSAEQELDRIYHAIPEWVHRQYPTHSLADRVRLGFESQQKMWTETFLREVKDHRTASDFSSYLTHTHGLDHTEQYWNFLMSRQKKAAISDDHAPKLKA